MSSSAYVRVSESVLRLAKQGTSANMRLESEGKKSYTEKKRGYYWLLHDKLASPMQLQMQTTLHMRVTCARRTRLLSAVEYQPILRCGLQRISTW